MRWLYGFLLSVLFLLGSAAPGQTVNLVGGLTPDQAIKAGERMYREGILPSGKPMQALVQGDIPVDGRMFTCRNCHLRSGLGTAEGTIISLPTNGRKLFRTLHRGSEIETNPPRHLLARPFQSEDIRPTYTDESLADAIWTGRTPSGRELSASMPRYLLDPPDMDILVYYLKHLSTDFSPGVDKQTLFFATVITDEVPAKDRRSMLGVLQAYIRDHNARSRHDEKRARHGPFYRQDRFAPYRRFDLSIWELHGPPSTWEKQLTDYAARKPVFALLGGISTRDWTPIDNFCNKNKIPCIFPVTDNPGLNPDNWYTLYFSRGLVEEAETAARYLAGNKTETVPPLLVYDNTARSRTLTEAFIRQWTTLGQKPIRTLQLPTGTQARRAFWQRILASGQQASLVLWLQRSAMKELFTLAPRHSALQSLLLSWRMLDNSSAGLPESWRDKIRLTYPYRLPGQLNSRLSFVKSWLRLKKLPIENLYIQAQTYFLGWVLTGSTRMMGDDFYRDYFLDVIDMMNDEVYAIATVPRASFGAGQRYAVKGCYIVGLDGKDPAKLVPLTPWVVY
ncbi:ABC transporter substrate-binding protein [Geothermobacter hydrogeniphilus]|uniref:Cytochrome c domain-containing protein n=1 Tax=Geothermobacter hydrogeniphilus TaxID=1969733 RepID=A0A1X0XQ52_9BACT|nr:ABC transporter substrate-binding protein [Geothermobacter hydrogeniphilus]ORJ54967.1 hypothetical protein B5V00_15400 [Geothermobacter hydrogeniphilus]